jgi:hypothetical protein
MNEYEMRLSAILRAAAKEGNLEAKRAWRLLNGYPEVPLPPRGWSRTDLAARDVWK